MGRRSMGGVDKEEVDEREREKEKIKDDDTSRI